MSEQDKRGMEAVMDELKRTDPEDLPVIGMLIGTYNAGKAAGSKETA